MANGKDLTDYYDCSGQPYPSTQDGPATGDAASFATFEQFYAAFEKQMQYLIKKTIDLYNRTDCVRATYAPTPYLSLLVKGCAEKGKDITRGGAEIRFVTIEGVTFGTTVDSLLAIKYLVYDKKLCTMDELIAALRAIGKAMKFCRLPPTSTRWAKRWAARWKMATTASM